MAGNHFSCVFERRLDAASFVSEVASSNPSWAIQDVPEGHNGLGYREST
jgi:hypothetical protein